MSRIKRLNIVIFLFAIAANFSTASAQELRTYLSKRALKCIAENSEDYIAAKQYDYTIIIPSECPKVPKQGGGISNEFIKLPENDNSEAAEAKSIIVLVDDFECLKKLAIQVSSQNDEDLIHVDIGKCEIID